MLLCDCPVVQPTVCHYFMKLLKDKGLLRRCYSQVCEPPARSTTDTLTVCVDVCILRHVHVYSEYWHSGAGGWTWGWRSNWSSWNVLYIPLCQLLLPQGVQPGLDERLFFTNVLLQWISGCEVVNLLPLPLQNKSSLIKFPNVRSVTV